MDTRKTQELLSVVVPIYNSKRELTKCVNSILKQSYHHIELILVDDGSVDGSGEMCDAFAESDARVRVIHQKNAGVSAARNQGLQSATGRWLAFVDSDDYLDDNYYQVMIDHCVQNNVQMVVSDWVIERGDNTQVTDIGAETTISAAKLRDTVISSNVAGGAAILITA